MMLPSRPDQTVWRELPLFASWIFEKLMANLIKVQMVKKVKSSQTFHFWIVNYFAIVDQHLIFFEITLTL